MSDSLPARNDLSRGLSVSVVEKQNQKSGKETAGEIEEILTNSDTHPHGIKVKLIDGRIGRVKRIVETSE